MRMNGPSHVTVRTRLQGAIDTPPNDRAMADAVRARDAQQQSTPLPRGRHPATAEDEDARHRSQERAPRRLRAGRQGAVQTATGSNCSTCSRKASGRSRFLASRPTSRSPSPLTTRRRSAAPSLWPRGATATASSTASRTATSTRSSPLCARRPQPRRAAPPEKPAPDARRPHRRHRAPAAASGGRRCGLSRA